MCDSCVVNEESNKNDDYNERVKCDHSWCMALKRPITPEDYKEAYYHWRYHECKAHCSHWPEAYLTIK